MLTLEDAQERLLARARLTHGEEVELEEALGRVLVDSAVHARIDVPPFDNSAMDGFAVRSADTPGELRLAGEVAAGSGEPYLVDPGTAVRIMTGAPLPTGADAVVPLEDADETDATVRVPATESGRFVRRTGGDTAAGAEVRLAGQLGPAAIAVLASLGIGTILARRRPIVAILSTGDELVAPGFPLRQGQIYDANAASLAAAVAEAGGQPDVLARVRDEASAVEEALKHACLGADLVVASGGVSVGRHDHVRGALERAGNLDFWRIAVQPGKPLAVGELSGRTVIGLPGNPVSALVTFELFVRPYIRATLGLVGDGRLHVRARPDAAIAKDHERRAFLRVSVRQEDGGLRARSAGDQGSAQLRPLADANGLLIVPEGEEAGDPSRDYDTILIGTLG
jgi:molybdopterin molybdotransferase